MKTEKEIHMAIDALRGLATGTVRAETALRWVLDEDEE